ncbi:MAG: hypothetical protein ACR2FO_03785 [Actinomycetota bacterium]
MFYDVLDMSQDALLELVEAHVAPAERPWARGLPVAGGTALPFVIERSWAGPAGYYWEQWSIRRGGRDAIFTSEPKQIFIKGLQSVRTFTDRVEAPISIGPGTYNLVFIVGELFMGSVEIKVEENSTAAV